MRPNKQINRTPVRFGEVRFGGGSDFGLYKPFRFFDLPSFRSESPTTGFGMGSVGVGSTEKTLGILQLTGPDRGTHNPLVPGSSPSGPTIFINFI